MPNYSPPPANLDHLNPIQRYMQKGSLDYTDYAWLLILVLGYMTLRPYTQKALKWLLAPPDVKEGEKALEDHYQSKAKVDANAIRGSKAEEPLTLLSDENAVTTSGSKVTKEGHVSNRKTKNTTSTESEKEKLEDWDEEPARGHVEGDKSDVMAWLDKWDK